MKIFGERRSSKILQNQLRLKGKERLKESRLKERKKESRLKERKQRHDFLKRLYQRNFGNR